MIYFLIISSITILSDSKDSLVVRYSADYTINEVNDRMILRLEEGKYPDTSGVAAIPQIRKKILIPRGGQVDVKHTVLSEDEKEGIAGTVNFYDRETGKKIPGDFTTKPVKLEINRNAPNGNATLIISPFSYRDGIVTIRKEIMIKIYFSGGRWIRPGYKKEIARKKFLNQIKGERFKPLQVKTSKARGIFLKVKTTESGLFEITPEEIEKAGLQPGVLDPSLIEVRGSYTGVLPWEMDSLITEDTLPGLIPAIYSINGDGSFNGQDKIIFYAQSLEGWDKNTYNKDNGKYFYKNPYADTNIYWLKIDGNPVSMSTISQSNGTPVSYFTDTIHLEEESFNPLRSGLAWVWEELSNLDGTGDENILDVEFSCSNPASESVTVKVGFYPKTHHTYTFKTTLNSAIKYDTVISQGVEWRERTVIFSNFSTLSDGINQLEVELTTADESIFIDYIEIIYRRQMKTSSGKFAINSPSSGINEYSVEGFSENSYVLDVTAPLSPDLISFNSSDNTLNFSSDANKIFIQSGVSRPDGIKTADPDFLYQGSADWLMITDNKFIKPATKIKNWRNIHLGNIESPRAKIVTTEQIYDNFSSGVRDPSAIKRFLYWTQLNWNTAPGYVFLLGDGSYDFHDYTGMGKTSIVPIHTKGTAIYTTSGYLDKNDEIDGWFVDFDEDAVPDIPIGRVTASRESEALNWVDKLIGYEKSTGGWRRNAVLLADDAYWGTNYRGEKIHTAGMESVSENLPEWIFRKKVYLMEFPRVGDEKPAAARAFVDAMSEGAIFGCFLGHGNLRRLTHETVFPIDDVREFGNWRMTPFFYFGSCDVGYFERPDENCIGGFSNLFADGGNIVSVAAGRATYPFANNNLGRQIARFLFADSVTTAGEAFLYAKQLAGDKTYTFFGDPGTTILHDSITPDVSIPDTATGGEKLSISGSIKSQTEKVHCLITESNVDSVLDAREEPGDTNLIDYEKIGKVIYRGSAGMVGDSFQLNINLPWDLKRDSGFVYLYSGSEPETYTRQTINFIQGTQTIDSLPQIYFQFGNRILETGDFLPGNGKIKVVVKDSNGLDLRNRENLRVRIDEGEDKYLTGIFEYNTNSSTTGEAEFSYEASAFSDTIHFWAQAKDNMGQIGTREATFRVEEDRIIWGVENYPNPMKDKTTIIYNLNREIDIEIKIFTISGRLVKEISPGAVRSGTNYVEWDGKDDKGRKVSNGIYYLVIKAGESKPVYGKIAVIR